MEPISGKVTKNFLKGPKVDIDEHYGGLGIHFLDTLYNNFNQIHQIDAVTGITETKASVRSRSIQVADELLHFGITDNDIVLICCRSHADQTVVVLATLLVGAIVAPIDSELPYKECKNLVAQLKPKVCFCDLRSLKQMERVFMETEITSKMVHFGDQQQYAIPFRKLFMKRQYPEQFKPVFIENPRKRVSFILATQGTSGTPKLVCLSHHFVYNQISLFLHIMQSPKKIISYYPLAWVLQVILMGLCFQTEVVRVLPGPFVERTACKLIHDLKIDYAFINTDLALKLVEHAAVKDFNLSSLKCVYIGGLTTTSYDVKRLVNRLPKVKFTQFYCTTETGVVIGCPLTDYDASLERIGTIGKVTQNTMIKIVDIDTRKDVDAETTGELLVASDCMMLGYFKNMDLTKSCTEQGFFKTGDMARYDVEGWVFIEGSTSDLIKVAGVNESPREIEATILMHPLVKDAAVIGNNQEIVACVILKSNTELQESKLLKFIADASVTQPTKITYMEAFPTTPLGKIRRDLLKEQVLKVRIEHSIEHIGERK